VGLVGSVLGGEHAGKLGKPGKAIAATREATREQASPSPRGRSPALWPG